MWNAKNISLAVSVGVFSLQVCVCVRARGRVWKWLEGLCFLSCALDSLTLAAERRKKGLAVAHTAGGLSRGVPVKHTHTRPKTHTHTHEFLSAPSSPSPTPTPAYAALMMQRRNRSMGGTIRVRDRRAKGDDSLVLTDNFFSLTLFPSAAFFFLKVNYSHVLIIFFVYAWLNVRICMCVSSIYLCTHV